MADQDDELLALGAVPADDSEEDSELLALGAMPSDRSPSSESNSPDIGMGESALRGSEQGLTLGFADEAGSALGAGLEGISEAIKQKSFGPVADENLKKLYNEYLEFNRKRYEEAEKANPKASLAGNLVGGALLPVGGLGIAAKGASLGQKVKAGAGAGALLGGSMAAGSSEAPVMSGEFVQDVGIGTGLGLLGGAALPVGIAGVKGAANITGSTLKWAGDKIAGPVKEAFDLGKSGINAMTEKGQKTVMDEVGQFAGKVGPGLKTEIEKLATLKNQLIKDAEEAGVQLDSAKIDDMIQKRLGTDPKSNLPEVQREMEQLREVLRTSKEGALVRKQTTSQVPTGKDKVFGIAELKRAEQEAIEKGVDPSDIETIFQPVDVEGQVAAVVRQITRDAERVPTGYKKLASRLIKEDEIPQYKTQTETVRAGDKNLQSPEQMLQLYKDLKQKSSFGDASFQTQEAQNATAGTIKDVQDILRESIPGLQQADTGIHQLNKAADSIGIKDTMDINEAQIRDKILSIIGQEGNLSIGGIKAQERINDFISQLEKFNKPMADNLRKEFHSMGAKVSTIKEINKPLSVMGVVQSPLGVTRQFGSGAANLAGLAAGKVNSAATKAANIGAEGVAKITGLTPQMLKQTASKLSANPSKAAQELSGVLIKAADMDDRARNALLFGIMQNPAYRQWINPENEDKVQ